MLFNTFVYRLRGEASLSLLIRRGLKIGKNLKIMHGTIIDDSHPWLIEIGDNVTLAPRVHILAHDASTKNYLGYTKIGRVVIGDNVFIGADSVILPGVAIGNNVIIGANSTVTHSIPEGMVVVGCPAHVICSTEDYLNKERKRMKSAPLYDESYTLRGNISEDKKQKQRQELANGIKGYVD